MRLFQPVRPPEPQEGEQQPQTIDPRVREAIEQAEQQNSPIRNQPEALDRIISNHQVSGSLYHYYQPKNTAMSNMREQDDGLMYLLQAHTNLSVLMEKRGIVKSDIPDHASTMQNNFVDFRRAIDFKTATLIGGQNFRITNIEEKAPDKTMFKPRG